MVQVTRSGERGKGSGKRIRVREEVRGHDREVGIYQRTKRKQTKIKKKSLD